MQTSRQIVTSFFEKLIEKRINQDILLLNFSRPQILNISGNISVEIETENDFIKIEKEYFDTIIGDLPFGMQSIILDTISQVRGNKNWSYVLRALRLLKNTGQAFFLVEPGILFSQIGKRFLSDLLKEGFYCNSVFEVPEKLLYPETLFQPIIIHFEKQRQDKLFIAEITSEFEQLLKCFHVRKTTNSLSTGIIVEHNTFESFNRFRIENEIKNLTLQYSDYKKYVLKNIAKEINTTRGIFSEKQNSIYIPLIGNSAVVSDIKLITVKPQNLFQVVLNQDIVKAEFLALFFRSNLGQQILKSLKSGNFIAKISKHDISNSTISVPSLMEQDLIILTDSKLSELQDTINQLKAELSLNPRNANAILDKFENIQSPLKQLSEEDKILSLIRRGENKHIEFKETFSKNIVTGQKDKEIEKSSLKNIVGFLNADGGTLLIGVSDKGEIKGVESDFFQSPDKYKLNFKNEINSKIGAEFYSLINYDLFTVKGKWILKVNCEAANEPCFFGGEIFYVRTNPATDELKGKKQIEYIKERFRKQI